MVSEAGNAAGDRTRLAVSRSARKEHSLRIINFKASPEKKTLLFKELTIESIILIKRCYHQKTKLVSDESRNVAEFLACTIRASEV